METFDQAFKKVLGYEGEYSDDSHDRGGKTRWGITESSARRHGYQGEMRDFPLEAAKEIYRVDYWDKNRLDQVADYDPALAIELFEVGVNMGTSTAGIFLQQSINALSNKNNTVDSIIGSKTLEALEKLNHPLDKPTLLKMINVLQGSKYIAICTHDPTQKKFIHGWFSRVEIT